MLRLRGPGINPAHHPCIDLKRYDPRIIERKSMEGDTSVPCREHK